MKQEKQKQPPRASGWLAGGGVLSGFAAFVGASCCVLPILLVNLGLGAALAGELAFFARARGWFLAGAAMLIAASFVAAFWRGRRPSGRVLAMLAVASLVTAGAYWLPHFEPQILRELGLR